MKTTASIVTYNTDYQELSSCIGSLMRDSVDMIYIVDNSSDSKLREFVDGYERIKYIHPGGNLGYGKAHNIAIRKAMEENATYHLVINPDVKFDPGTIGPIKDYMDLNQDVGQLIPNMIYPDGKLQYSVRLLPTPINLIFRRFIPGKICNRLDDRYLLKHWRHDTPLDVPYHQGSFMFFRLSALKEIGLFDEQFFMYPEDIDITRRMHRKYRTMFWPRVTVVHNHHADSYHSRKMLKIHIINIIRYFNKWGWLFDRERRKFNRETLEYIRVNSLKNQY